MKQPFTLTLTDYELACVELFLTWMDGPSLAARNRIFNKVDVLRAVRAEQRKVVAGSA